VADATTERVRLRGEVKARSVRIIITDPGADSTARISEVEIFGKKAR
jgi:hypothetical protein